MTKPSLITHCTELRDKDIFVTPKGCLALIIPGEPTLHEFYIDDRVKVMLGIDLIASGSDKMVRRISHLDDVNCAMHDEISKMENEIAVLKGEVPDQEGDE